VRRRGPASVALSFALPVASLFAVPVASAGTDHLGGFRPVASETSARALWVNPAGIGVGERAVAVLEMMWLSRTSGTSGQLQTLNLAAGAGRAAYGFQWEFDDDVGVADWAVTTGSRTQFARGGAIGTTLEYRGGDEDKFDVTAGLLFPLGGLKGAFVVRDILEADTDSLATARTFRAGAAYRSQALRGFVSYDYVGAEKRDGEHWLGLALDQWKSFRISYLTNTDGDWNAQIGIAVGNATFSAGRFEPDEGEPGGFATARRDFAAWDWAEGTAQGRTRRR
jgi:hypothetical protein